MTDSPAASAVNAGGWICPFCPLACDHLEVVAEAGALALRGADCPRASRALARFPAAAADAAPEIAGTPVTRAEAIAAGAGLLAASRQPLFGGLGTDVAGARALYPLAAATGAICDPAGGVALMHGLRALQDRGQFTTTLAEVRTRADLIVFVGGVPADLAPLIGERCGIGEATALITRREVIVIGGSSADEALLARWSSAGVATSLLPRQGDLYTTVALLAAAVAQRPLATASGGLLALAQRLRTARYAVLVGTPARLPAQGALIVEALHRIVGTLNETTRAAALWIGGGDGAATVNQTFAWLSGLPLRSRAGPRGLEHEPQRFDAARLLADGAVDALLWLASFDPDQRPPATELPLLLLGHPALAEAARRSGAVFIPVATPGIDSDGHLFRTDGTVLMPLRAVRAETRLPSAAAVLAQLNDALRARRAAGVAS